MNLSENTITPGPLAALNKRHDDIKGINNAAIIIGLQSKHVYAGTVPELVVRERRAKNRDARRARRGNVSALRRQARLNRVANRRGRRMPYSMGRSLGAIPGAPWLVEVADGTGMTGAEVLAKLAESKAGAAE